jgi:putative copper resistance protein D
VLALLAGVLWYASVVSAAGSLLVWSLRGGERDSHPLPFDGLLAGAVASGLLAGVVYFLLRVGAVSQQGLAGMGDWQMGRIMADTALGDGTALRLLGFLVLALSLPLMALIPDRRPARPVLWLVATTGLLILAGSFAALGHARELTWTGRLAAVAHVLAISLWTGSLWPLWRCCRSLSPERQAGLLRRFGDLARWMLAVMLISGGVLVWQLTGSFDDLTGTAYGRLLLTKLLLVAGLVTIGAWHRYRLVPALGWPDPSGRRKAAEALQRSILLEAGLAALIIAVTVVLTGLFSPPV